MPRCSATRPTQDPTWWRRRGCCSCCSCRCNRNAWLLHESKQTQQPTLLDGGTQWQQTYQNRKGLLGSAIFVLMEILTFSTSINLKGRSSMIAATSPCKRQEQQKTTTKHVVRIQYGFVVNITTKESHATPDPGDISHLVNFRNEKVGEQPSSGSLLLLHLLLQFLTRRKILLQQESAPDVHTIQGVDGESGRHNICTHHTRGHF